MTTITVPDFQYAAMYYPEVLEISIQKMRANTPEVTDENEAEPYIQLIRSFALGSHLNTVLLDLVAKECFLASASLRSSVKRLLELIDYDLAQASPAVSDLVLKLSGSVTATTQITVAGAQFSTPATSDTPAIPYEDLEGHSIERTDELTACLAYDATGDVWTDHTTAANTPASTFNPGWGAAPEAGDLLVFTHGEVQWNELTILVSTIAADINGVWEYYDGFFNGVNPESVSNLGPNLRVKVNSILGTVDRTGAVVRVFCNLTGASEDLTSAWDGSDNYVDTTGFLGQVSPSVLITDYAVSVEWREPVNRASTLDNFTSAGSQSVEFDLPQTRSTQWRDAALGFSLRYRIVSVGGAPVSPLLDVADIDEGDLFLLISITQGESRIDDPLGSSTALVDQEFTLSNFPVIDDDSLKVFVDEGSGDIEWTRVDNFLNSTSIDRHFTVEFDDDGKAIVKFGNDTNGKIPPAGADNISSSYRTMNEVDGNVGPLTITQNQTGSGFISEVYNPRTAAGYQAREGATAASLATAKEAGPASLRTGSTAASPEEIETLTVAFTAADGTRPFTRALAIEEGFGVKTIEDVVVGAGGVAVSQTVLDELDAYFNSDTANKEYGVLVANHQVTGVNFSPLSIAVTATVFGGNLTSVETALTALLNPESKDDDAEWTWDFGGEVPLSRIISEIMNTTPKPRKTTVTLPASDTTLAPRELPTVGTLLITIVA